jgi:hypothetical protein
MADPVIKFLGDGSEYLLDIPARSLSTSDYDALDNDQRAAVRKSPLYDYATYRDALNPTTEPAALPTEGT